jgi:hypothetical protein
MDGTGLCDVLHPDEGPEQSNGQIFDNDGWGHLMIVMEGEPKEIWSLLPYGESEDPSSPHYNDQTKLHSRHEIKQFWFTPQQIRDYTESVWGDGGRLGRHFRLRPAGRPQAPVASARRPTRIRTYNPVVVITRSRQQSMPAACRAAYSDEAQAVIPMP